MYLINDKNELIPKKILENLDYESMGFTIATEQQIFDIRLNNKKEYLINEVNLKCEKGIFAVYSQNRQRNIDREAYIYKDDTEKQTAQLEMNEFIQAKLTECRDLKSQIEACETFEELTTLGVLNE